MNTNTLMLASKFTPIGTVMLPDIWFWQRSLYILHAHVSVGGWGDCRGMEATETLGAVAGSPMSKPPEGTLAGVRPNNYGDVWSMAATICEIFTGDSIWDMELFHRHQTQNGRRVYPRRSGTVEQYRCHTPRYTVPLLQLHCKWETYRKATVVWNYSFVKVGCCNLQGTVSLTSIPKKRIFQWWQCKETLLLGIELQ